MAINWHPISQPPPEIPGQCRSDEVLGWHAESELRMIVWWQMRDDTRQWFSDNADFSDEPVEGLTLWTELTERPE